MNEVMALSKLAARLRSPAGAEAFSAVSGAPCVIVELDGESPPILTPPNCPVIAISERRRVPDVVDVVVATAAQAARVAAAVSRNPIAAMVLVRLLRHNEWIDAADALFAESLAYSTLQHGAEFQRWLAARPAPAAAPAPQAGGQLVLVGRDGDELRVTLNRPDRRNAYSDDLRDALCEALAVAVADASIRRVILDGAGACFSAGGDLDEFGRATDAGRAHAARMTRGAGVLIYRLRDRLEARLHGACIGAGIELPAFAGRLVARADSFFQLPEVGMGLIPGAGGTVSLLRRVGRRRLAFMALTGERIDAATALAWGLVDAVLD